MCSWYTKSDGLPQVSTVQTALARGHKKKIPENQSETFSETQLLVSVWGDGIIHSVILCFECTGKTVAHNQMCDALVSVVTFQCDYYEQSANDNQDVVSGICRFVFENDYNSGTHDLLLSALSNALHTTVNVFQYQEEIICYHEIKLMPCWMEVVPTYTISLLCKGDVAPTTSSCVLQYFSLTLQN